MTKSYATVEELIADNPGRWLAVDNRIVKGGPGTAPMPDGHAYWSKTIDGRIWPQNFTPGVQSMDNTRANLISAGGNLMAVGAKLYAAFNALKAVVPDVTEAEWLAAEKAAAGAVAGVPAVENAPAPKVAMGNKVAHLAATPYPVQVIDDDNPAMCPAVAGVANPLVYPKVVHTDQGVNIVVKEPLNRKWKASGNWWLFGVSRDPAATQIPFMTPGSASVSWGDPSNGSLGSPPMPLRTAAGYPISYTFDQYGKMIGTPTVDHDGHGFNNDAEVEAYMAAEAARPVVDHSSEWAEVGQRIQNQRGQPLKRPTTPAGETAEGGDPRVDG